MNSTDKAICRWCGHTKLAHEHLDTGELDCCSMPGCGCDKFDKMYAMKCNGKYYEVIKKVKVFRKPQETTEEAKLREERNVPPPKPLEYTAIITKQIKNYGYVKFKKNGAFPSS